MLNLADFRATATRDTSAEAAERINSLSGYVAIPFERAAVLFYEEGCFIEELANGFFRVTFPGHESSHSLLTGAEEDLYFNHYVSECGTATERDIPFLSELLPMWCAHNNLTPASADELILNVGSRSARRDWLQWFIEAWEDAERREEAKANGGRA